MHNPQDRAARRRNLVLVVLMLLAIAIIAAPHGWDSAPGPAYVVGVPTGETVGGAPVYRLPPVEVVARRGVEPAGGGRDAAPDAARAAQVKLEPKPST